MQLVPVLLQIQWEFHIEIDNQTGKVTAIATGSTEVKTTDLLKECDEAEARKLAEEDYGPKVTDIRLADKTDNTLYTREAEKENHPLESWNKKDSSRYSVLTVVVEKCLIKDYEENR